MLVFGPAAMTMGLLVFGVLTGHVPLQSGALRVPAILLGLIGLLFSAAGLGLLLSRLVPKFAAFCGLLAFCAFVGLFNWIAFGPGERYFSRSITSSAAGSSSSHQSAASEAEGRLVFSLFAGALDALILYGLYHGLRRRNATLAKRNGG